MSNKRVAHRWRLSAVMIIGIIFAFGSFYLVQLASFDYSGLPSDALKSEPDYIVEKFSFVRMGPSGQPRYIIAGDKLTHRPIDDIAVVEQPVVNSLTTEHPPMTMHAKQARIDQAKSVIHLNGAVDIERVATPLGKGMILKTEALTLYTDEDRMETDQPFNLQMGRQTVTGVGMKANNATGKVDIQSKTRFELPARQR